MIPCFLNAFNQSSLLKGMVERLSKIESLSVIVIDNASTEPSLLEYYRHCGCRVIRLEENLGHRAGWDAGIIGELAQGYYLYSDSDLDVSGLPDDFVETLIRGHEVHGADCAGVSLEIGDLPDNGQSARIREWENQFWMNATEDGFFRANVDTTLALYHMDKPPTGLNNNALRAPRPVTARHLPWYFNADSPPPPDYLYYLATCNESASWAASIRQACSLDLPAGAG